MKTDIRDIILNWLKENKRPVAWLSEETGIPNSTLHFCLKKKLFALSDENLSKIEKVITLNK